MPAMTTLAWAHVLCALCALLVSCDTEEQAKLPHPYRELVGDWDLVESHDIGEIIPIIGYSFRPEPPTQFNLDFNEGGFFVIEGLEHFGMLHVRQFDDESTLCGGNNGVYYCTFDVAGEHPTMKLKAWPNVEDPDRLVMLAEYTKREP